MWIEKIEETIQFFMHYFFQEIPKSLVIRYSYNFKKMKLLNGSTIYKENDPSNYIYLIRKGEAEVTYLF
jgi:CRP-like cAMP-binding protein